jgi:hypothetical protein
MHKIESLIPNLPGWSSVQKCMKLYSLIVTHKIQTSVEVGVFGGRGSLSMAFGHLETGGTCWGVDPYTAEASLEFETDEENIKYWGRLDYETLYRDLMIQSLAQGLTTHHQILRMKSEEAVTIFKNQSLGLVVIDANHNFETCSRDFEMWLPKIYDGGFLLADDLLWDGVSRAKHMIEHYGFKEVEIVDDPAGSQWGLYQKIETPKPE